MKLVKLALKEKGFTQEQLSQELQDRIVNLEELQIKYSEACDLYDQEPDKNEETEAELDKMEDYIASVDEDIANEIKNYEIAPEKPAETPAPEPKKKEGGGIGWLIFGGLALVATLGAVNLMKKR